MTFHPAQLRSSIALLSIAAAMQIASSASAQSINGRVTSVTLYRGQAQVTRAIPLEGDARSLEIVVGDLPEQVVPDSLFAEGGESVEIRWSAIAPAPWENSRARRSGSLRTKSWKRSGR
jgi:hypothetical protein